ncbi:MAG: cadherin-like domain-containing protein, partial [Pirellulaceae bacterium]|nr:cadherin-like domain-containing protein [Pirellulaceae bacterium]
VDEDSPAIAIDLTTIFFDPDVVTSGDQLTYSIPTNGNSNPTLVTPQVTGNTLTLPLGADSNGQALVRVQARDIAGQTVVSTLTLNVRPINDAPRLIVAIPDQTMAEDAAPRDFVLTPAFFFDPDLANGDTLTLSLISNSNALLVTPTLINGGVRLTLVPNQFGTSQIIVRATDGTGLAVSDSFILTVTPDNDAPTAVADTYTVPQGGVLIANDVNGTNANPADNGVLANDSDLEGTSMSAVVVRQPQFGRVTLNGNGTFTYTHTGSTRDTDTFTYRASDGSASSEETTVTINVGLPLPPPHQNPINQFDVNADTFVSAIDALLIINRINSFGSGPVTGLASPPPYLDVSGDNSISPLDALLVIDRLNRGAGGEGEGEAADWNFDALASASAFQYDASRVTDNQPLAVHTIPVVAEVFDLEAAYELGLDGIMADWDNAAGAAELVAGWPDIQSAEVRHEAADEALGSFWAEFPTQKRQ